MKVAFTSSDGVRVDEHFGATRDFWLWEIAPGGATPLGRISALAGDGADEEDRTSARANAVAGCAIVCTVQIGGPAAAKLVARRVHPMKIAAATPIAEVVAKLRHVLEGNPPPWLRKAMNGSAAE
jgi:nitrogen fixation protein NifX